MCTVTKRICDCLALSAKVGVVFVPDTPQHSRGIEQRFTILVLPCLCWSCDERSVLEHACSIHSSHSSLFE